jgi:hypothetical protein
MQEQVEKKGLSMLNTKLDLNECEILSTNMKYLEQTLQVKEFTIKTTNNDGNETNGPTEEVAPGKPLITFNVENKLK